MTDPETNAKKETSTGEQKQQAAELLDHEYDGIREYDNPLPGWWVAIFWGTFFFAIGYVFHYHVSGNGTSIAAAYEEDMAEARAERAKQALGDNVSEAALTKLMGDESLMADAKAIFLQRCTPCHGQKAEGAIGPNLTDDYWIHGRGKLMDIYHTIDNGVPDKGMPPWGLQLPGIQVKELAAFVGSLRGTKVPGKAPEGKLVAEASGGAEKTGRQPEDAGTDGAPAAGEASDDAGAVVTRSLRTPSEGAGARATKAPSTAGAHAGTAAAPSKTLGHAGAPVTKGPVEAPATTSSDGGS